MAYDILIIQTSPTQRFIDQMNFKLVPTSVGEGEAPIPYDPGVYVYRDEIGSKFISETLYSIQPETWNQVNGIRPIDDDRFDQMYLNAITRGTFDTGIQLGGAALVGLVVVGAFALASGRRKSRKSKTKRTR